MFLTWFNKVHVSHCHVEFLSSSDDMGMLETILVFELPEGPEDDDPICSLTLIPLCKDLDPHHKSSCSLRSAAMAAACIGLSADLMSVSPPIRFAPEGNRPPRRALFSAAVKADWRRDDKGCLENPPNRLPGRSNPFPVPVMPLAINSSHSCRKIWIWHFRFLSFCQSNNTSFNPKLLPYLYGFWFYSILSFTRFPMLP